jgi:hypothetical protein
MICAKTSEVHVLQDELEERRAVAVDSAVHAAAQAAAPGAAAADDERERRHDELLLILRLLDDLRRHVPADRPLAIVGPTWLLDRVIRGAAGEAVKRLREVVDGVTLDRGRVTPDELRAALDTACAPTATLIGLDHTLNHAVDL